MSDDMTPAQSALVARLLGHLDREGASIDDLIEPIAPGEYRAYARRRSVRAAVRRAVRRGMQ